MRNNKVFIISENPQTNEFEEQNVDETSKEIKTIDNDASYWNIFHVGTIVCISGIQLAVMVLVPRHNSIIYPSYWFEFPLIQCYTSIIATINIMTSIYLFTNQKTLLDIAIFLKFYFGTVIINIANPIMAYFLWVIIAGKNHPIPFLGLIAFFASIPATLTGIFLAIPSHLLKDIDFNRKLKTYLKYAVYWYFIHFQKDVLSIIFKKLPSNFQFVIAFIIPLLREGNKRFLSKLVRTMAGKEDERANVWMSISLNIHYALFITIKLAGAENITVFSIMIIDFIFHLIYTYRIIRTDKNSIRNGPNKDECEYERRKDKKQRILKLLLAETIEGIVPLGYATGFIMAYYGPNSMLYGNVGSGIWAYEVVEDIGRLLKVVFGMFGIDVLSVLLNGICLYKYGNVNLIQNFLQFLRKYWLLLGIKLGHDVYYYFSYNDINLGVDMTTEFTWITDKGRINFINDSTTLTDEEKEFLLGSCD